MYLKVTAFCAGCKRKMTEVMKKLPGGNGEWSMVNGKS